MMFYENGGTEVSLDSSDLKGALEGVFPKWRNRKKVMLIPPDITRLHSRAGEISSLSFEYFQERVQAVLPALGTHAPMDKEERETMFPGIPAPLFVDHNWREDIVTLGRVPAEYIREVSEGKLDFDWPAQVNSLLVNGGFDLILSIGQVVPHEVIGMANYNKNIFAGTGGPEGIGKSHFLGASYGMERIMGRADTPVRRVLNYASDHFAADLPIVYIQTVVGSDSAGQLHLRGLFIGDDAECFEKAAELSLGVNITLLETLLKKIVVHLSEHEYKSSWLGNKAVYRTRMALAEGGELIILAPGVRSFGEDPEIDRLIRKHGYSGTENTLKAVQDDPDLAANLGAAAHLIHGSSEGRFKITYCTRHLSREEIEQVGYHWIDYNEIIEKYDPTLLQDGFNRIGGEEIYFISEPGLGLWSAEEKFKQRSPQ
jgi:nickel-dependent lactate racemase